MDPMSEGQAAPVSGAVEKEAEPVQEQKVQAEIPGLGEGRIVHYVLQSGSHRPAIIVRNWHTPGGSCNLQVFLDGMNDRGIEFVAAEEADHGLKWCTSILHSSDRLPGTWHWPEKA